VPYGGVVVDLDMIAEHAGRRDIRVGKHDAAVADACVRTDQGRRVDDHSRDESSHGQRSGQASPSGRIRDCHHELDVLLRFVGVKHRQAAARSHPALVQERNHRLACR
jgi:hypothetical protein